MAFDTAENIRAAGHALNTVRDREKAREMGARLDSVSNPDPPLRAWIASLDRQIAAAMIAYREAMSLSKITGVPQPGALDEETQAIYNTILRR